MDDKNPLQVQGIGAALKKKHLVIDNQKISLILPCLVVAKFIFRNSLLHLAVFTFH